VVLQLGLCFLLERQEIKVALSNILREPRREITESVAGIAIFIIPVWLDYHFAVWLYAATGGNNRALPVPIGMIAGVFVVAAILGLLLFTHFVGEEICDFLADRGLELRPRNRR